MLAAIHRLLAIFIVIVFGIQSLPVSTPKLYENCFLINFHVSGVCFGMQYVKMTAQTEKMAILHEL